MKLFKDYTFHWWQIGLLKIALLALGILIGSYWQECFHNTILVYVLWTVFILNVIYISAVTYKKMKE